MKVVSESNNLRFEKDIKFYLENTYLTELSKLSWNFWKKPHGDRVKECKLQQHKNFSLKPERKNKA